MRRRTPRSTLFPYTTLFRSWRDDEVSLLRRGDSSRGNQVQILRRDGSRGYACGRCTGEWKGYYARLRSFALHFGCRSEEHTSELQSRRDLVCRLLLEKKKKL